MSDEKKEPQSFGRQSRQVNIETPMAFMYRQMYGIDPAECREIGPDTKGLEIEIDGSRRCLPEFLKESSSIVTIDFFSTKENNDAEVNKLAKQGMPPHVQAVYKRLYLSLGREWFVLKHREASFGIADRLEVYNGYPNLLTDYDAFACDPEGTHERVLEAAMQLSPPEALIKVMTAPAVKYSRTSVHLHRNFLAEHPIFDAQGNRIFY